MSEIYYLTKEGLKKLTDELNHLKIHERANIAKTIAEARAKGDLKENAEYHAAKEAQGFLELKISKLENDLATSRIIDKSNIDVSKVTVLASVKIKNIDSNQTITYKLVPEIEADLKSGKISVKSPIAKALLGKVVNDVVEVIIPAGKVKYKVLQITH